MIAPPNKCINLMRRRSPINAPTHLGSGQLATELDRLDLIDEYKLLVHPRIAGHGPTLYESGLPARDGSS